MPRLAFTRPVQTSEPVVVQIKAGGEEYEVYLTNLAKTEDAYEVTVPFSAFKGKTGGKLSGDALKDVQAFGLWCNSNHLPFKS